MAKSKMMNKRNPLACKGCEKRGDKLNSEI